MKNSFRTIAVMTLAALAGCTEGTPGGPGTTQTNGKMPTFGQADETFNLTLPATHISLQQGEKSETTVGIKRGKNFDDDVSLKIADIPKGVTVEPTDPLIKHGDTDAKIVFKAVDEAPLGDFTIKLIGHPSKGGDAQLALKLTVTAKDSFTLTIPRLSKPLKQGETQTVSMAIKRDKTFDQDVTLTFGDMPTGVTLTPDATVIHRGDSALQLTLTCAEDAALGDFTVKVAGHPAEGADAKTELNFTVTKK